MTKSQKLQISGIMCTLNARPVRLWCSPSSAPQFLSMLTIDSSTETTTASRITWLNSGIQRKPASQLRRAVTSEGSFIWRRNSTGSMEWSSGMRAQATSKPGTPWPASTLSTPAASTSTSMRSRFRQQSHLARLTGRYTLTNLWANTTWWWRSSTMGWCSKLTNLTCYQNSATCRRIGTELRSPSPTRMEEAARRRNRSSNGSIMLAGTSSKCNLWFRRSSRSLTLTPMVRSRYSKLCLRSMDLRCLRTTRKLRC